MLRIPDSRTLGVLGRPPSEKPGRRALGVGAKLTGMGAGPGVPSTFGDLGRPVKVGPLCFRERNRARAAPMSYCAGAGVS